MRRVNSRQDYSSRQKTTASKKGTTKRTSRFSANPRLRSMNQHINFDREGEKTTARKEPTEVICCQCKTKFILPFKPRNPEVYCDKCFKKKKR